MALLNLENIAVLAISKEAVQGIGHGSPQVIIRLVFVQIISKITGSEVTPFAVITDESTGVKYPLAGYELLPKMAIVDADMMMNTPGTSPPSPVSTPSPTHWKPMPPSWQRTTPMVWPCAVFPAFGAERAGRKDPPFNRTNGLPSTFGPSTHEKLIPLPDNVPRFPVSSGSTDSFQSHRCSHRAAQDLYSGGMSGELFFPRL